MFATKMFPLLIPPVHEEAIHALQGTPARVRLRIHRHDGSEPHLDQRLGKRYLVIRHAEAALVVKEIT